MMATTLTLLAINLAISAAATTDGQQVVLSSGDKPEICSLLSRRLNCPVVYPDDDRYTARQHTYWSAQQAELRPKCRLLPEEADDIVHALGVLVENNSTFAVHSGGHTSNVNASNAGADAVTIDLLNLSEITLVDEDSAVWLGPAATWSEVYTSLQPHGLTVSGGRVGHVGVGGYVLGGGFSWYANRHGWACDSVLEFEIVTPDRQVLQVSKTQHPDLFWALKGSLGAYGIVTRIKMITIRNDHVFGGAIAYDMDDESIRDDVLNALDSLAKRPHIYLNTQGYLSLAWQPKDNHTNPTATMYVVDTTGEENPAIKHFKRIPHLHENLRKMTIGESAAEISDSNPLGLRRSKFTFTMKPQDGVNHGGPVELMGAIREFASEALEDFDLGDGGLLGITMQPLNFLHLHHQTGVFSASLEPINAPMWLVSVEAWWAGADKDAQVEKNMRVLYEFFEWMLGLNRAWVYWRYPNYAASWQSPFEDGWLRGETLERLREVRRRYDPEGIWRMLVPGIWHV